MKYGYNSTFTKTFRAYQNGFRYVVNQGGTSCFDGDTLIVCKGSLKKIKDVKKGDLVKTYNEDTNQIELNRVIDTFKYKNSKRTVKVNLKNGYSFICTEDHKFYHNGWWHEIKHLLSLLHGNMEINTEL